METTTIHIQTERRFLGIFQEVAKAVGATISSESVPTQELTLDQVIEQGEKDFREGRGVTLTIDQLRAMVDHAA
ncbi:hypothetical protein ACO2Q8_10950 [Larkinella sp. VNQ87]|uniref:hypothetical protein n=1 Tax=Larkinella sp. VNQ87 TaxID=3400921 RepID=UPI003C000C33